MPVIHIHLTPEEYERARRAKGGQTWTEFFMMLVDMYLKGGESGGAVAPEDIEYLRYRITDLEDRISKLEEGGIQPQQKQLYERVAQIEERLRTLESVVAGKISGKYEGGGSSFTTADKLAEEKGGEESEPRPRARRGDLPATKKQIRYMRALMMETKVPVDEVIKQTGVDITRDESEITREEASRVIDYLEAVSYTHLTLPTTPYV